MDRQERRIGCGSLLAKTRQHDRHHFVVAGKDVEKCRIKAAGPIVIRRRSEFVVEAELIEKCAQPRVVVRAKACMRAERVWNLGQRLAEMGGDQVLVRNIVRHLAKAVQVVGKRDEAGFDPILGQDPERVAHHARAGDLAKSTDMRQARRPIAGLEQNLGLAGSLDPRDELARFLEWPGIGLTEGSGEGHDGTLGKRRTSRDRLSARAMRKR